MMEVPNLPETEAEALGRVSADAPTEEAPPEQPSSGEPSELELLRARQEEAEARAAHFERIAGRHAGRAGFLEKRLRDAGIDDPDPEGGEPSQRFDSEPDDSEPSERETVAAGMYNAKMNAIEAFASAHPDADFEAIRAYLQKQGAIPNQFDEPEKAYVTVKQIALLPRLHGLARRMAAVRGRPDFVSDLVQEAALAILQAPPPWNEGKAMVTAQHAMQEACRLLSPLSACSSSLYRYGQVRHATAELWRRVQRRPSDEEVAAELRMRPSTVRALRDCFEGETLPPFTVGDQGDEQERLQHPGRTPEDMHQTREMRQDVARAVDRLAPVQAETVLLRFGLGHADEARGVGWIAGHREVTRASVNGALSASVAILARALHGWAPGRLGP